MMKSFFLTELNEAIIPVSKGCTIFVTLSGKKAIVKLLSYKVEKPNLLKGMSRVIVHN